MAHLVMLGMLLRSWFLFLLPLFLLFVHYFWFTGKTGKRGQRENGRLPPSPPALPIIGRLHLLGSLPHRSLRSLASKYGPDLMLLRLGVVPTLVVSSPRAAEAVLRTHDHALASRPHSMVTDILMYGSSDVAFAPYGQHWRQARKLLTNHMLSVRKVQSFRSAVTAEVSMLIAKINEVAAVGGAVDMSELLKTFTYDMTCRIVSRESLLQGGSKLFQDLINDTSRLLQGFKVEDYFPALDRVGLLKRTVHAKAERLRYRWANLLDKVIDDHESKDKSELDNKGGNFVDILLSVQLEYGLTRDHMKALLTDVFFGSTDTSSNTLEFTLAEIIRRPHLMKKLQDEVRSTVTPGQEILSEADVNNMTYLRAVIKAEFILLHLYLLHTLPRLTAASMGTWFLLGRMSSSMYGPLVETLATGRTLKSSYLKDF